MALYCIWLRYAAIFFWIVSFINIGVVVVYLSGDPKESDDYRLTSGDKEKSVLYLLTFLNISNTIWKVAGVYINCMIVVTGLTLLFIFKYTTKYKSFETALIKNKTE